MERTSSERRLLAESSSYEQDAAPAAAAPERDENGKARERGEEEEKEWSPVRSISAALQPLPETQPVGRAECDAQVVRGHFSRRLDFTSPSVANGNDLARAPRVHKRFANGAHPDPASATAIPNTGEKEHLAAAAGMPPRYLGSRQILQPPPGGRGMVDKMNRPSFRRMVGRTARRSGGGGGVVGTGGSRPPASAFSSSSAAAPPTPLKPRRHCHEESTNDEQQRGNHHLADLVTVSS